MHGGAPIDGGISTGQSERCSLRPLVASMLLPWEATCHACFLIAVPPSFGEVACWSDLSRTITFLKSRIDHVRF